MQPEVPRVRNALTVLHNTLRGKLDKRVRVCPDPRSGTSMGCIHLQEGCPEEVLRDDRTSENAQGVACRAHHAQDPFVTKSLLLLVCGTFKLGQRRAVDCARPRTGKKWFGATPQFGDRAAVIHELEDNIMFGEVHAMPKTQSVRVGGEEDQ